MEVIDSELLIGSFLVSLSPNKLNDLTNLNYNANSTYHAANSLLLHCNTAIYTFLLIRDEDPKVFSSDPDPAQQKNRIRIRIRLGSDLNSK